MAPETPTSSHFKSLQKHEEYYLTGGDLFILVEQYHFRVHRYFFQRESSFFQARLNAPASPGSSAPGSSESAAIILPEITPSEFSTFLWVFYNPKYSLYDARPQEWVTILKLAHRWDFPEVRAGYVSFVQCSNRLLSRSTSFAFVSWRR